MKFKSVLPLTLATLPLLASSQIGVTARIKPLRSPSLSGLKSPFFHRQSSAANQCDIGCSPSPDGCICGGSRSDETAFIFADIPYLISPRSTNILDGNPLLRWYPVEGATSYRVRVKRGNGELIWEVAEVRETEVRYGGEIPLEPGVYDVIVNVNDTGASSAEEELKGWKFRVLGDPDREEIQSLATQQTRGLTGEAKVLALAEFYASKELYADAIALLESRIAEGSATARVYHQLGDRYRDIRFPPLAAEYYLEAIAQMPTDAIAETAELQGKLGTVYRLLQEPDKAINQLQQAQANYQTLGNSRRAGELQVQIEQIQRDR
ncbi:MAG: tetratricopeptide repeat protein [Cyanobacteriota bacterium]|nr:tetratricopeptide repeat protein [Cyanobacteriota bacterium]